MVRARARRGATNRTCGSICGGRERREGLSSFAVSSLSKNLVTSRTDMWRCRSRSQAVIQPCALCKRYRHGAFLLVTILVLANKLIIIQIQLIWISNISKGRWGRRQNTQKHTMDKCWSITSLWDNFQKTKLLFSIFDSNVNSFDYFSYASIWDWYCLTRFQILRRSYFTTATSRRTFTNNLFFVGPTMMLLVFTIYTYYVSDDISRHVRQWTNRWWEIYEIFNFLKCLGWLYLWYPAFTTANTLFNQPFESIFETYFNFFGEKTNKILLQCALDLINFSMQCGPSCGFGHLQITRQLCDRNFCAILLGKKFQIKN